MSSQAKYLISILWMSTKQTSRKKLQRARKSRTLRLENENNVIEKVVENAQMDTAGSRWLTSSGTAEMVENYARRLQSQGLNIDQYMQFTGMTPEKLIGADASGSREETSRPDWFLRQ